MEYIYDSNTGVIRPAMGAAEMWGGNMGAAEMWTGGPLADWRDRMRAHRGERRADRAERMLPPGFVVVQESDLEALLKKAEQPKYQMPQSFAPVLNQAAGPNPLIGAAAIGSLGGAAGLTITAGTTLTGAQASGNDTAVSNYPFYAKRMRIRATGADGFGIRITQVQVAQSSIVNGNGYEAGANSDDMVVDFASPIYVPAGPLITVTRQGSTGIVAATGSYSLTLEG